MLRTTESTVVVCARNEESLVKECIQSISSQTIRSFKIIFIADRCTDRTSSVAKNVLPEDRCVIIEKYSSLWSNSIPENLEIGRQGAIGDALVVVDADIVVPIDFLKVLLPQLRYYASVSAVARTDPSQGILNAAISIWEKTYIIGLANEPRGGARAISLNVLNRVGGLRDVESWDTELDIRLRRFGYRVKLDRTVKALHRRRMTIRDSISYQRQRGRSRRELGVGLVRTLLHSILRLRPFVIQGYVQAQRNVRPLS